MNATKALNASSNGLLIMDKPVTVASYTASIGTAAGGLFSLNEIALILGIIFTAITFFVNWRYQVKRHLLELQKRQEDAEFHKARMAELLKQDSLEMIEQQPSANDDKEVSNNA
ncbi:hypothetical protein CWB81_15945 [Pseudoalteromonas sp. S1688]|nr:hypothetical protein CWB81_15945 [Pseudoalteromonas sp. S1688]